MAIGNKMLDLLKKEHPELFKSLYARASAPEPKTYVTKFKKVSKKQ